MRCFVTRASKNRDGWAGINPPRPSHNISTNNTHQTTHGRQHTTDSARQTAHDSSARQTAHDRQHTTDSARQQRTTDSTRQQRTTAAHDRQRTADSARQTAHDGQGVSQCLPEGQSARTRRFLRSTHRGR